jgi:hypothetical protein
MQQRGKHLDGCGLPCPVGAKKGEDLASRHVKRNIVYGGKRAKGFYEVLNPDQWMRPPGQNQY